MADFTRRAFTIAGTALMTAPFIPQVSASTPKEAIDFHLWNDVSNSVTEEDLLLEKLGCREALTDPYIMDAILGTKDVLANYGEFSTGGRIVVDWRALDSRAAIQNFADTIVISDRYREGERGGDTGINNAYFYAREQSARTRRPEAREVIDVSGDGVENVNTGQLALLRTAASDNGVQCNGIVFPDHPGPWDEPFDVYARLNEVYHHYSDAVITEGGFVEIVEDISHYPMVFRQKLQMELGLV